MYAAETELKNAEKVKRFLLTHDLLDTRFQVVKEFDLIFFPMRKKATVPRAKVIKTSLQFPQKEIPVTIEELLKDDLTKKQLEKLPRSQEIVGTILILEIPEELTAKEKIIAEVYLKVHKTVETVVKKEEMHAGVFRTRKVKILAGKRTKETIHLENGVKIKLHLEKTYFSARSANERLRVAKQVKKGEEILVMFSGAAPYPLVLAKHSPAKIIYGIEINPLAHRYAVDNVSLNNFNHKIAIFLGDVQNVLPKMKKKFDRIVMPLPKTGEEFLPLALEKIQKGGVIHLYAFLHEEDIDKEAIRIKELCKTLKHPVKVIEKVKCGQFSPGTFRVCFDLKII